MRRTIIVHCHIFKNAGSTFDWCLQRCLGERFLDHREDRDMKQGARYLGPFLNENRDLQAISSHHVRLPLPKVPGARLIPAFFIRHPIERVYSVYAFERRQPEVTLGARMAKELSFSEYVRRRMEPDVAATLRDFQTRRCAPGHHPLAKTMAEEDLAAAVTTLESTPLTGVVDLFDESMMLMEAALQADFPGLDLAYVSQNVSGYRTRARGLVHRLRGLLGRLQADQRLIHTADTETEQRAQRVLDSLGSDLGERLLDNNRMDLALYRKARTIVRDRFNAMEDAEQRLAALRTRCRGLSG